MTDISFLSRMKILFSVIFSSPFFISVLSVFLLTTLVLIIYNRINNKAFKYFVCFGYLSISILIIIKYGPSILKLSDSLIDKVFSMLYFPNIISYLCMIIITTLLLIMTFLNNKLKSFIKVCNIITFVMIEILFVLTLDVIIKNNVDIYDKVAIYSNETLMVLIQASTALFGIWFLILFIDFIVEILNKKLDNKSKEYSNITLSVDDVSLEEPVVLTDAEFEQLFAKIEKNESFNTYSSYK